MVFKSRPKKIEFNPNDYDDEDGESEVEENLDEEGYEASQKNTQQKPQKPIQSAVQEKADKQDQNITKEDILGLALYHIERGYYFLSLLR